MAVPQAPIRRRRRGWKRVLVAALAVAGAFGGLWLADTLYNRSWPMSAAERVKLENYRRLVRGDFGRYRRRPHTVYSVRPGQGGTTNSLGFRGPEWPLEPTPGVPRIVCLGASTTESGNPQGPAGSYPLFLGEELETRLGHPVEVFNAGVSGWTTAETLVAWFLLIQDYRPDVVLVHHAVNDVMPRDRPDFRADYTHWRKPYEEPDLPLLQRLAILHSDVYARRWLRHRPATLLQATTTEDPGASPFAELGYLPPETSGPYRRNLRSIGKGARRIGASVALMTMPAAAADDAEGPGVLRAGLAEHNDILRTLAAEEGWHLVDAERDFQAQAETLDPEFLDLVHLGPAGNRAKARLAAEVLERDWYPTWDR